MKLLIIVIVIKKYEKNEIRVDPNYTLAEFKEEKDIIPEIIDDNEEDIKSLEKSFYSSSSKS